MPLLRRRMRIFPRRLPGLRPTAQLSVSLDDSLAPDYKTLADDLSSAPTGDKFFDALARFQRSAEERMRVQFESAMTTQRKEQAAATATAISSAITTERKKQAAATATAISSAITTERKKQAAATATERKLVDRKILAYGSVTRGIFYKTGGATLASIDFVYQAGSISSVALIQVLDALGRSNVLSYNSAISTNSPSPPARGIAAYILTRDLMALRRPSGARPVAVQRYTREEHIIRSVIGQRSPAGLGIWPLLAPNGQVRLLRNVGAHELSIRDWLVIAENEMVTGHVAGHIPPLLTRMYDLWKKVFGCQVEDARKVLGDQFVNDPGNVFFNPYDNDDADTEADVLDPRSQ